MPEGRSEAECTKGSREPGAMKRRLPVLSFFYGCNGGQGLLGAALPERPVARYGWLARLRASVQSLDVSREGADLSHAGAPRAAAVRRRTPGGQGTGRRFGQRFLSRPLAAHGRLN